MATEVFNKGKLEEQLNVMTDVTGDGKVVALRLLDQLFSVLDETTSDSVRCGYFNKIVTTLIRHNPSAMMVWLHGQGFKLVERLVSHMDNNSVAQTLIDLLQLKDPTDAYMYHIEGTWTDERSF